MIYLRMHGRCATTNPMARHCNSLHSRPDSSTTINPKTHPYLRASCAFDSPLVTILRVLAKAKIVSPQTEPSGRSPSLPCIVSHTTGVSIDGFSWTALSPTHYTQRSRTWLRLPTVLGILASSCTHCTKYFLSILQQLVSGSLYWATRLAERLTLPTPSGWLIGRIRGHLLTQVRMIFFAWYHSPELIDDAFRQGFRAF
jgi:hypothetical protein